MSALPECGWRSESGCWNGFCRRIRALSMPYPVCLASATTSPRHLPIRAPSQSASISRAYPQSRHAGFDMPNHSTSILPPNLSSMILTDQNDSQPQAKSCRKWSSALALRNPTLGRVLILPWTSFRRQTDDRHPMGAQTTRCPLHLLKVSQCF